MLHLLCINFVVESIEKFITDGWAIVNIPDTSAVNSAIEDLEAEAYRLTGASVPLSELLRYITDFDHFHLSMANYFWEREHGMRIAATCLPVLKDFIGLDILVQYKPYLRISRPGMAEDNIGYHKDTQYGQLPYEIALHVPFVALDEKSSMRVISGSHLLHEGKFTSAAAQQQARDGIKHTLGYPYSPKRLNVPDGAVMQSLSMKVGQMAIFTPALFHGQEINEGENTRISIDLRVVNKFRCPADKIGKGQNQYQPVANSPCETLATRYYEAQNDQTR